MAGGVALPFEPQPIRFLGEPMPKERRFSFCLTCFAAAIGLAAGPAFAADGEAVEEAITEQANADAVAAQSQTRIDALDDATSRNLQAYRIALQRLDSLTIYNDQLSKLITSQQGEIGSIERQTEEIETIETGALPLMIEMIAALGELVAADVPFLLGEREKRVGRLRELIDRADVTAGEKFRRVMEAYLVEVEFGRTIEAYRGELEQAGAVRTVDFLRVGRVGLYYQTLDGVETGRWNPGSREWEILDDDARRPVQTGLRIARKQAPPELLTLPVNAPEAST